MPDPSSNPHTEGKKKKEKGKLREFLPSRPNTSKKWLNKLVNTETVWQYPALARLRQKDS
jgi:hypothetical protein